MMMRWTDDRNHTERTECLNLNPGLNASLKERKQEGQQGRQQGRQQGWLKLLLLALVVGLVGVSGSLGPRVAHATGWLQQSTTITITSDEGGTLTGGEMVAGEPQATVMFPSGALEAESATATYEPLPVRTQTMDAEVVVLTGFKVQVIDDATGEPVTQFANPPRVRVRFTAQERERLGVQGGTLDIVFPHRESVDWIAREEMQAWGCSTALCVVVTGQQATPAVTLEGRAVLPADTIAPGPPAGHAVEYGAFGRQGPFAGQPVQGVSAVLPAEAPGHYLVMSDNGFGAKDNSADYHLRWYEVAIDFESGTVEVVDYTELQDPDHHISWPIVNEESRILTGADFDLESFRKAPDGTFWFGEEFGPFLLHVAADGTLLAPPIPTPYPNELARFARHLPFVQSPEHPDFFPFSSVEARATAANLPSSRGFEGMALNTEGTMLYPLLEGALLDDPVRTRLLLQEFDLETEEYTGDYWYYPLSNPEHAIGEMTAFNECDYLVIERDMHAGEAAGFKRIFAVDLCRAEVGDQLAKRLVVDLLNLADEQGLTTPEEGAVGLGAEFSFPFVTIESVYPVDEQTLLVINDNNYPFSSGRRPDVAPDNTEFILVGLPETSRE